MMTINLERRSKLHIEIYEALKLYMPSIRIIEEYNLGNNLFVDIYLPDYSICIEIDGEQHDRYIKFFHGNDMSKFYDQKNNDKRKYSKCRELNLYLYRVKYKTKSNPIEIVKDIFEKWVDHQ